MSEDIDNEVDVDDESLAIAAGGVNPPPHGGMNLPNSPINAGGSPLNLTYNSTLYF